MRSLKDQSDKRRRFVCKTSESREQTREEQRKSEWLLKAPPKIISQCISCWVIQRCLWLSLQRNRLVLHCQKDPAWCVAVVDDERRVELGSRQFANNPKTIPQLPEGAGIRRLLPTSSEEIDQSFALAHWGRLEHLRLAHRRRFSPTSSEEIDQSTLLNIAASALAVQKQSCLSHNEKTFSAIFFASSVVQLF